ncbi:X-linked retinitis pigmentosa GTPase regulator-like [Babylonia areolata]|uniref:X-linked retinitis pigmentosa GTPase regulator-like n=1 Tax=Babylonia areolata TaxID=304850 RepID=UPI003FD01AB0
MAGIDDSDVPDSGAVFIFGKSRLAEKLPSKFWLKNDRVLHVACGDEHSALVAESGRVFVFGPNQWGQLGLGTSTLADRPSCIKSLKHEKCKWVACGRSHTVFATVSTWGQYDTFPLPAAPESGKLYACGSNEDGQLGVKTSGSSSPLPGPVVSLTPTPWTMLAAGCDHSMALTEGRVVVWGSDEEGQLGQGQTTSTAVPSHLDVGHPVRWISCGYHHSALVTEAGEVWTWGDGEGGKLGRATDDSVSTSVPGQVTAIGHRAISVACGGSHTAVLTDSGQVYTFGSGPCGQLGLGESVLESASPYLLALPFRVTQVCCGENFTAIVSDKGQLYTCGDGRHGKLCQGPGNNANQFTPALVHRLAHLHVDQVACGGCHMMVRARPRPRTGREGQNGTQGQAETGTVRSIAQTGGNSGKQLSSQDTVRKTPVITAKMRKMDARYEGRARERQKKQREMDVKQREMDVKQREMDVTCDRSEESRDCTVHCAGRHRVRDSNGCVKDGEGGRGNVDKGNNSKEADIPEDKSKLCVVL